MVSQLNMSDKKEIQVENHVCKQESFTYSLNGSFYNLSGFGIYVILKNISYSPKGHLFTMKEKATGITSALTPDLSNTCCLYVIIQQDAHVWTCIPDWIFIKLRLIKLLPCFFVDCMIQQKLWNMSCFYFFLIIFPRFQINKG